MAVDSKAKRFSMINFGEGDSVLIDPDGTIAAADKAHLLGLYSGIALAEPGVSLFVSNTFIGGSQESQSLISGSESSQPLISGTSIGQLAV